MPKLRTAPGGVEKTHLKVAGASAVTPAAEKRVIIVNRVGSVQTNLVMGNIAIDRRSPDYVPLVVMNQVFGRSAARRACSIICAEDKGYTYGAYSGLSAGEYAGPWEAAAKSVPK